MILFAGGTGMLGTRTVRLLTARGLTVRVLTRDPSRAAHLAGERVEVVRGDVRDRAAVSRAAAGARVVVSAVHGFAGVDVSSPAEVDEQGNVHLVSAAREAGAEHFVLISALGASPSHPMDLYRAKHRAEETVRAGGVAWTIVRPTAFMELWARMIGEPLLRTGKTMIFGEGRNPINFVSTHDVARFVEMAVVDPAMRGAAVDVPGPENLTFVEVAETFRREGGGQGAVRHLPRPVMRVASTVLRALKPSLARQIHAGVVMDTYPFAFDGAARTREHPSIPMTTLAEVVRRDFPR